MKKGQKYQYLPHPADLKIRARGDSLEELFANAVLAMMEFIYGPISTSSQNLPPPKLIKIKTSDLKSLLVDWLSKLLYLSDTRHCAYTQFKFEKLTDTELTAEVAGQPAKAKEDIKAVTYHGLEVKQVDGGWEAVVLCDI